MKLPTDLTENQITDLKNRIMGKVRRTIGYNEAEDKTAYESAAKTILFHGFVELVPLINSARRQNDAWEKRWEELKSSAKTIHQLLGLDDEV